MFESLSSASQRSTPQPPPPPTTPLEIHTMPEKFQGGMMSKAPSGKPPTRGSRKLLIIIGIIVVVALGVGAAVMFTGVLDKNSNTVANANLVTNTPVNTNGNQNVNQNANGNTNLNANLNLNENANANGNTNLNGNLNSNANGNVNVNNPLTPSSADADKDGLTDVEETAFGTNPSDQDTDGDSFSDGSEVKLGYSPQGKGKLVDSSLVSSFTNTLYGATVLFPRTWTSVSRTSTEQLLANASNDESITVAVMDNVARLTAKQWYVQQAPSIDPSTLDDVQTWDGKSNGVRSPDGLAYYFANGSQMYVISLSFGPKPAVDSRTIFEMTARSLAVDPTKVNLNMNTNAAANVNSSTNQNTNLNSNTNSALNANSNSNTNSGS